MKVASNLNINLKNESAVQILVALPVFTPLWTFVLTKCQYVLFQSN